MFTTDGPFKIAPRDFAGPALLVALLLAAPQSGASARPKSQARTGSASRAQRRPNARLPAFADYPARESFGGRPAPVRLRTRRDRGYRTRLREGAAAGPNFAGRYTFVYWGCGTGCAQAAVVDAKTGLVYWPPLEYADIPTPDRGEYDRGYEYGAGYRRDSRLLVLTRSNYDREASYTAYFYLFDRGRFRLLREALLKRSPIDAGDDEPPSDPADPKLESQVSGQ